MTESLHSHSSCDCHVIKVTTFLACFICIFLACLFISLSAALVRGNRNNSQQFASSKCDALMQLLTIPELTHGTRTFPIAVVAPSLVLLHSSPMQLCWTCFSVWLKTVQRSFAPYLRGMLLVLSTSFIKMARMRRYRNVNCANSLFRLHHHLLMEVLMIYKTMFNPPDPPFPLPPLIPHR